MRTPSKTIGILTSALATLIVTSICYADPLEITVLGGEPIFLAGRYDVFIPPLIPVGQPFVLQRHNHVLRDFVQERFPTGIVVRGGGIVQVLKQAQGAIDFWRAPSADPFPPEGRTSLLSKLDALGGLSGYVGPAGALVGVFLDNNNPADLRPPPALDFSTPESRDFTVLAPALRQIFCKYSVNPYMSLYIQ